MKKFSFKSFALGVIATGLITSGVTVFAEPVQKSINAVFGQVKLVVDGKAVDKETLLYNGTTYVPLRAAAEALGKEVAFDGGTNTAYIDAVGTSRKFEAAVTTPEPKQEQPQGNKGTFGNPYKINEKVILNDFDNTLEISVIEAVRGEKALNMALREKERNEVPGFGKEYYFAKININAVNTKKNEPITPYYGFSFSNEKGKEYKEMNFAYNLGNEFTSILAGGQTNGWVYCIVDKEDDIYVSRFDSKVLGKIWIKPEKNSISSAVNKIAFYKDHATAPDYGALFNIKPIDTIVTSKGSHDYIYNPLDINDGDIAKYANVLSEQGYKKEVFNGKLAFGKDGTLIVIDLDIERSEFNIIVMDV